jgi:hypothetical protein
MKILNYKVIDKGTVKAEFALFLPEVGMTIRNCMHFAKGSNEWVSFPSKKFTEKDGSTKYFPYIMMASKDKKDAFDKVILQKIHSGDYEASTQPVVEGDEF